MERHKFPILHRLPILWLFYVDNLYLLQGTKMKQHNLGFLTMKIYAIKTYDIFFLTNFNNLLLLILISSLW